jgi:adenylate kinase
MTSINSVKLFVLLGAPGSGKGTVAQFLKDKYAICYFSTGNLLRNEVKRKTEIGCKVENILGSGGLVGDDIVNEIVQSNIAQVLKGKEVIILDGYPRTESQAIVLDGIDGGKLRDIIRVIELDVDPDEVVERISRRRVCSVCGNTYGPMDKVDVCSCGGKLVKRKDDEEATVRNRLNEYEKATLPLSRYYSGRIVKISGKGTPEEVARRVDEYLCGFGIERRR